MRIYEFAKKYDVASKDLIDLLKNEGFVVGSHMSVLSDEAVVFLDEHYRCEKHQSGSSQKTSMHEQVVLPVEVKSEKIENNEIMSEKNNVSKSVVEQKKDSAYQSRSSSNSFSKGSSVVRSQGAGSKKNDPLSRGAVKNIPFVEAQTGPLVLEAMSIASFAQKINRSVSEVVLQLLKLGIIATKNQIISEDVIKKVADKMGVESVKKVAAKDISNARPVMQGAEASVEDLTEERMPVVVVLGHVDHGKTTLLDFIRKTRIASREKGGITQHIGAYQATSKHGDIVFIDTPGHEAFGKVRQRGLRAADIAVIVVAADDGVMPQTVEVIKQVIAAGSAIIVAINKMDRANAVQLEAVKRQLTQYGLVPEDWGGQTLCVPISAKTGDGIDALLEMIVLQAHVMELKTNAGLLGRGYVLESKFERGRGAVATLICQHGSISVGDYFVCGSTGGRVNFLFDSFGRSQQKAGPSIPVQVGGFDRLPDVGDFFMIVSPEEYRRSKQNSVYSIAAPAHANRGGEKVDLINLVIKTDADSSREALLESIEALSKKADKGMYVVHSAVGDVVENDIELAATVGASVIVLHAKIQPDAIRLASQRNVPLLRFDIIYKLLEYLKEQATVEKKAPLTKKKIGQAEVLRVFDIKGVGVIAGSIVKDGRFVKDGEVVVFRRNRKVGEGVIKSLQREKRTVKEVHTGFECGFVVDGFSEWQVEDVVDCYTLE